MLLHIDKHTTRYFSQEELQALLNAAIQCAAANRCYWESAASDALGVIDAVLCDIDLVFTEHIAAAGTQMESIYGKDDYEIGDGCSQCRFEYDKRYTGGEYSDVGTFVTITPQDGEDIYQAFERVTNLNRMHVVHYEWIDEEETDDHE